MLDDINNYLLWSTRWRLLNRCSTFMPSCRPPWGPLRPCPTVDLHEHSTFMPDLRPLWALYVYTRPSTLWTLYVHARPLIPWALYIHARPSTPMNTTLVPNCQPSWALRQCPTVDLMSNLCPCRPSTPINTLRPYPTVDLMSTLRPF